MGTSTGIAWTDHTFNPWRGCTKVSAGCLHCYAETMSKRNPAVLGEWGPEGSRAIAAESYWRLPERWDSAAQRDGVRRRVFCASLADVFEDRPDLEAPRARLFDTIGRTRNLDWLLLTKRPKNIVRLWPGASVKDPAMVEVGGHRVFASVWLGVSVEDQKTADERIPLLLQTPAAVHFVSYEPALGPVRFAKVPGLNKAGSAGVELTRNLWVIVGGESGPRARACDVANIRRVIAECAVPRVPVFVKQLGANPVGEPWAVNRNFSPLTTSRSGADPSEWPEDLRVREFPEVSRG